MFCRNLPSNYVSAGPPVEVASCQWQPKHGGNPQELNTESNLDGEKSRKQAKPQVQQTGRSKSHIILPQDEGGNIEIQKEIKFSI